MDRNIYLPPYFPSLFLFGFTFSILHGQKYLPVSLSQSLWIYLFQPTWTEISECHPLSFAHDLPFFSAYMDRNIYLPLCFPSLFLSGFTFPSLHGQKYLPASLLSLSLSLWIYLSQLTWTEISTCFSTFPLSFSLGLPFPAYMDRNIYLPPYFPSLFLSGFTSPSLHGEKYIPASLLSISYSLMIYLFSQPTQTEISTFLLTFPLSFSLDLPFPAYRDRNIYLPLYFPSLFLSGFTFLSRYMDRNIYLPPSFPSFFLSIFFPAYMDRNIYLPPSFPSLFLSISFPSLHGQKYLPVSLSLFLWIYLSQPTWTEISAFLPLPISLDLPFPAYMNRNIHLHSYFPALFLSGFTFPTLYGQKCLPASLLSLSFSLSFLSQPTWPEISTCLPLSFSLDLPFPAYMDRNI
jgi:hypothetical protein